MQGTQLTKVEESRENRLKDKIENQRKDTKEYSNKKRGREASTITRMSK